jgi:hypothetical protein
MINVPYMTKTRFLFESLKLTEYFLKVCESLLPIVKETLKIIDPVYGLNSPITTILISFKSGKMVRK